MARSCHKITNQGELLYTLSLPRFSVVAHIGARTTVGMDSLGRSWDFEVCAALVKLCMHSHAGAWERGKEQYRRFMQLQAFPQILGVRLGNSPSFSLLPDRHVWQFLFSFYKKAHKGDRAYQFWQAGVHPELKQNDTMMRQKLEYIHQNPVERGYVDEAVYWRYSSARNYAGLEGLLEVSTVW